MHATPVAEAWERELAHLAPSGEDWQERAGRHAQARARVVAREAAEHASQLAQRGGRGGGGGHRLGADDGGDELLTEAELREVEASHGDGITAAQVVDIFVSRGARFSEATFRKYVQQGLLPRSRRVGRKGKHRGSLGVYPAKTVRRVNEIKQLMADNHTIEEIKQQFLLFTDVIETLDDSLHEAFGRIEEEAQSARFDAKAKKALKHELSEARRAADELMHRLEALSSRVSRARGDAYRDSGAAGSAEELL